MCNPKSPAPTKETIAVPSVQNKAILFGCFFSFSVHFTANNAIAKKANGSSAEKIPPTTNQIFQLQCSNNDDLFLELQKGK